MKFILIFLCVQVIFGASFGQLQSFSLHEAKAQSITVSSRQTTVIYFPSAIVKTADRGVRSLLAQKEAGNGNVLKLKASQNIGFPTTLYAFTEDGRVYAFVVSYTDSLTQTAYTVTSDAKNNTTNTHIANKQEEIRSTVQNISTLSKHNLKHITRNRMRLNLDGIYNKNRLLYFRFSIRNLSNLDYIIAFNRAYLQDSKQAKRTSSQQKDLDLLYKSPVAMIKGRDCVEYIITVPQFTIPDHRIFRIEFFEKDGGRALTMRISNKKIFKTASLKRNFWK